MKNTLYSLLTAFVLTLPLTSCKGVFTKDDVQEVSSVILKDSLAAAKDSLAGGQMDWRLTATQIGMKAANLALQRATENLAANSFEAPPEALVYVEAERILETALKQAQSDLPTIATSPQEVQTAQLVAATSTQRALASLSVPGGGR